MIKFMQRFHPIHLSFLDLIKLAFEIRRKTDIQNVREILHEQIGDEHAQFRRNDFPRLNGDILAVNNRADNRRIRAWPPDALLFQFLH